LEANHERSLIDDASDGNHETGARSFQGVLERHVANVGLLTTALLLSRRIGVAALGRHLPVRTTPKDAIQAGGPVSRQSALSAPSGVGGVAVLGHWAAPRGGEACDWTKVRQWPVLSASVIYRGRALPILWAVLDPRQLHKSLNSFEHGFFTVLAHLLGQPGSDANSCAGR
jgi:hypothetical protein